MSIRELQDRFPSDGAFIDFYLDAVHGGHPRCWLCNARAERVRRVDVKRFR